MAVWRLQTSTSKGRIAEYCIKNNVIAMGWSLKEVSENERKSIKTFEQYTEFASRLYKKFDNVKRLYKKVAIGDFIWLRFDGKYFLSKVGENSQWSFNSSEDAFSLDACNQRNDINWVQIKEFFDEASVAGIVKTSFIKGNTLQSINNPYISDYSEMIYAKALNKDFIKPESLTLEEKCFYTLLNYEDVEDLLCLWLFKNKGYIVIPSTNKISTKTYECVLIDPKAESPKHIYIQAKKGKIDLNASDYSDLNGETYLVTTEGEILNLENEKNVFSVSPTDLFEFAINPENKSLIPQSIRIWIEFLSENKT